MTLGLKPPFSPMEAQLVDHIPEGAEWVYEPKWDGFRCLVFKDGDQIELQSKASQSLTRYFPEIVDDLRKTTAALFVLDCEIVIPVGDALSFEELLMRIHPAASRVRKLSIEHPALLIAFDLLADEKGHSLITQPFRDRRSRLEGFMARQTGRAQRIRLSPLTRDAQLANAWLNTVTTSVDGVVAKRSDMPYQSAIRTGMQKVKLIRTADCVIGGFRYGTGKKLVGSLLLGLYGEDGLLHHVGFTSGIKNTIKKELTAQLESMIQPPGFTGRAPGGPSRWSTERSTEWQPVEPKLVVEVQYDHFSGGRFRHGTRLVRWRPDKVPGQCSFDQVQTSKAGVAELLEADN